MHIQHAKSLQAKPCFLSLHISPRFYHWRKILGLFYQFSFIDIHIVLIQWKVISYSNTCADRRIRVFDTRYDQFREIRCIHALDVGWSILDLALRSVLFNFLFLKSAIFMSMLQLYHLLHLHTIVNLSKGLFY